MVGNCPDCSPSYEVLLQLASLVVARQLVQARPTAIRRQNPNLPRNCLRLSRLETLSRGHSRIHTHLEASGLQPNTPFTPRNRGTLRSMKLLLAQPGCLARAAARSWDRRGLRRCAPERPGRSSAGSRNSTHPETRTRLAALRQEAPGACPDAEIAGLTSVAVVAFAEARVASSPAMSTHMNSYMYNRVACAWIFFSIPKVLY